MGVVRRWGSEEVVGVGMRWGSEELGVVMRWG